MQSQKLVDTESVVVSKQAELDKSAEDMACLRASLADTVHNVKSITSSITSETLQNDS